MANTIEFNIAYKPLYKIEVLHSFYEDQPSKDFYLAPSPETKKLAQRLGIILKNIETESVMLYEPEKLDALLAEVENKYPMKFTYLLYSTNPYFINITDLPIESRSKIFYFSNNKVSRTGNKTLLHDSGFVTNKESIDFVGELEVAGNGKEKSVELKDDFDHVVFEKKLKADEKIILSNKNLPLGKYSFYVNGSFVNTFVLFSDMPVQRPIAVVDISLSGLIKEELILGIKENDVPNYNYQVSFSARSTFWKYFLIGKYNTTLKNTIIESGASKLKFKGPEVVKMKNGQEAVMFVSEQSLPLKQLYEVRFQLKNVRTGISNGKTIMDRLPMASPEIIKPESRDENSKIFSEIIVNI